MKVKTINPQFTAQIARAVNASNFFQLMSMRLENLGWGESELVISAREKHLQPYGIVHGGVCASLIDAACFWAVFTQAEEGTGLTTVDLKLNYLAPIVSGELYGTGRCVKLGKTIGLGSAEVRNEKGDLLAHGASTLMALPGFDLETGSPSASKFI